MAKKDHPEYEVWRCMIKRCRGAYRPEFKHYGARGIQVCARWLVFENFLADMGPRPTEVSGGGRSRYSVERIDNDGDYEPGNCRWATQMEQVHNRAVNPHLSFAGETLTYEQWSRRTGIGIKALYGRLRYGWSVERSLTTPIRKHRPYRPYRSGTLTRKDGNIDAVTGAILKL